MDPKESTTPTDDPNAAVTPPAADPVGTESTKTGDDANNLDPSKSDDTIVADDDKSKETNNDSDKTDDTPASKFDDDLDDWITKRGLKVPETDAEKQALQDLRNDQREFTRDRQAKKDAEELEKAKADAKSEVIDDEEDDELDDDQKRLKAVEERLAAEQTTRLQSEFYTTNKVTPEQHKALLDVMKEKFAAPTTPEGKKRAVELWSSVDALPDLLDLAKARLAKTESSTVAEEAARKEREKIERESNAKSPGRNASNTQTSDKTEDEARLERFKARYNKT
jgi:hypothetical protein